MEFNKVILDNISAFNVDTYSQPECLNLCVKYAKNFFLSDLRFQFISMFILNCIFISAYIFKDKLLTSDNKFKELLNLKNIVYLNILYFGLCIFMIKFENY
jgi:ABC-type multidrug transport system permease subunit